MWRINRPPYRDGQRQQTKGSEARVPVRSRSRFHTLRSSSVPASHHKGTMRLRLPFAPSGRTRRCGRPESTRTSSSCSAAISETRSPVQHAKRTMIRFIRAFGDRFDLHSRSASTAASSRRVRILTGSTDQGVRYKSASRGNDDHQLHFIALEGRGERPNLSKKRTILNTKKKPSQLVVVTPQRAEPTRQPICQR